MIKPLTDDEILEVLRINQCLIKRVGKITEELQNKIVDFISIDYIKYLDLCESSENICFEKFGPQCIKHMHNPSYSMQIKAVKRNAKLLRNINKPCREAQLIAVEKDPLLVSEIDNLCTEAQLIAVKKRPELILDIKNPGKKVQMEVLQSDYARLLFQLDSIHKDVQISFIKKLNYSKTIINIMKLYPEFKEYGEEIVKLGKIKGILD